MRLYVGNLSYATTEEQLMEAFAQHGEVASASLIMDRDTGRSKGFAFIDMPNDEEAQAAMAALDGFDMDGRPIRVNEAKPQEPRRASRY
jgi:RNA recognition motif-containing protein